MNKKFSIGLRINSISPAHVHFKLFCNLIPEDQQHNEATRASIGGELCLRNEEFPHFVERLHPDVILFSSVVTRQSVQKYLPKIYERWFEIPF